ncbi:MAG: HDIG domain-containing protein [Candidatus Heimdallarchaeota archaeon]|nr:HDIG domain-containing protein [Candidatus Heimdallarchaeota archaeon]
MNTYVKQSFKKQLEQISDSKLRDKVLDVCVEALKLGNDGRGWENMDFPFTLLIPNLKVTYADHVRIVTDLAIQSAKLLQENGLTLNMDYLIASAILHDVGKPIEYAVQSDGKVGKSDTGNRLRHPVIGTGLALKHELPYEVAQNIYQHSWEGERGPGRTAEGEIIHRCDFLHYGPLKISMSK